MGLGSASWRCICWARCHSIYSCLGLHSYRGDSAGCRASAHGTLCQGFSLSGSVMKRGTLPGWVCAEVSVLRIWADEPPCLTSLGGGGVFTGLARTSMHVGMSQGTSSLLRVLRESGCCALGHVRTCCLFFSGARAGPGVACKVFLLSCNAGISLLAHSPFGGPARLLLMGSQYWHEAATRWCLAGERGPRGVAGKQPGQDGCTGRVDGNGTLGQGPPDGHAHGTGSDHRLPPTPERVGWES